MEGTLSQATSFLGLLLCSRERPLLITSLPCVPRAQLRGPLHTPWVSVGPLFLAVGDGGQRPRGHGCARVWAALPVKTESSLELGGWAESLMIMVTHIPVGPASGS